MSDLYFRIALYSLSHGQMDLSLLNTYLWSRDCEDKTNIFFISESPLLPSRSMCSEEMFQMMNLKARICHLLIHSMSFSSWSRGLTSKRIVWGRRLWSQERWIWSGPSFASDLHLVWNVSLLLASSISFIHKISFPHIYCGKRGW